MPVTRSTAFIGEYVLGATAGAPLSTNANNTLVSGITNSEAASSTNATTTSATAAVISGMTLTPVAGTYLVVFSGWFTQTTGGATISFAIYVGGTQKADSLRIIQPFSGAALGASQDFAAATNGIVTVNGSQAIAIYWSTSGGTATVANRTMDIVRVA